MGAKLQQKTVVVTGASSGIGRAAALEFARRGANLVLAARRAELLEEIARECRAIGAGCKIVVTDVTQRADCEHLIDMAGSVDVLVNNAGFAIFDAIESARPDDLASMMQTNYFGTVWCTQAVLPQMLARGNGTIVNVASIAGIMGYARMGGYCATKFAVIGFSETLRDEVLRRGVRVAMVCPGTVETEFFVKAERGKMPGASRLIMAIKPEKVARAIANAAEDGRYRRILPLGAAMFMRFKELCPRLAHTLMRRVSAAMETKS
ncbi:MAG TPA: SDR family NAD(P)-dependent oxidoreductase [Thermoanaerobaculia bacterium]|nr:SDR family NAD(P)-dependent oxidoreductase [Thermoanaerobaculia bacterium]